MHTYANREAELSIALEIEGRTERKRVSERGRGKET